MNKNNKIDQESVNEVVHLSKKILKLFYVVLIIGIILFAIIIGQKLGILKLILNLLSVLSPLFIGFIIAWLFSPLVEKITKKGMSRILASIIVYVIFILFLFLFFRLFIPVLYEEINELLSSLPDIISKISDFINNSFDKVSIEGIDSTSIKDGILVGINAYSSNLSNSLPNMVFSGISSLASGIGTIFFGLIIGLYMLFDFDNITDTFIRFLPEKNRKEAYKLLTDIGTEVRKSVNGTLLVACMVFICDTIGFAAIGLRSALLFGLFCGITDLIPYIGPYLGTTVATIVGLTQSPLIGIGILIVAIIVQMIESYILQPIVMSKAINLHPVAIIVGLLIFGHFFGIIGMILATPILSIFKVIWRFLDNKYEFFKETKA